MLTIDSLSVYQNWQHCQDVEVYVEARQESYKMVICECDQQC